MKHSQHVRLAVKDHADQRFLLRSKANHANCFVSPGNFFSFLRQMEIHCIKNRHKTAKPQGWTDEERDAQQEKNKLIEEAGGEPPLLQITVSSLLLAIIEDLTEPSVIEFDQVVLAF